MTEADTRTGVVGRASVLGVLIVIAALIAVTLGAGPAAASNVDDSVGTIEDGDRLYQGNVGIVALDDEFDSGDSVDLEEVTSSGENEWIRELSVYEAGELPGAFDAIEDDHVAELDDDAPVVVIETDRLEASTHQLTDVSADGTPINDDDDPFEFDVRTHEFDAAFEEERVGNAGTSSVNLEIDSDRASFHVNVSADGLETEDLEAIFDDGDRIDTDDDDRYDGEDVIVLDARGTFTADFEDIDAGTYEFTVEATDTTASDTVTITVTDETVSHEFVEDGYTDDRGNVSNITVSLENTDVAAVQVGEYEDVSYEVGLTVEADDLEEVTLQMNTYTAGQAGDERDVWSVAEDDASVTVEYVALSEEDSGVYVNQGNDAFEGYGGAGDVDDIGEEHALEEPLAAGEYVLTVGDYWTLADDEIVNNDADDSAYLHLGERPPPQTIVSHTAPAADEVADASAFEDATVTETDLVADGDHMLFTVDAFGLSGLFEDVDTGQSINDEFLDEGIYLEIEQSDPPQNTDAGVWNSSAGQGEPDRIDLEAIAVDEYDGDRLVLRVDYENAGDGGLDVDEAYDVTLELTEDGHFADETTELESTVELAEPELEWDGDYVELRAIDGAAATGSSNLAPGTEIETYAFADGEFVEVGSHAGDVVTDSERSFEAVFAFGDAYADTEFELEASNEDAGRSLSTTVDGSIVAAESDDRQLDVGVHADEVTAGETATIEVTVEHHTDESLPVELTLEIGADHQNRTLEIDPGEMVTEQFEVESSELGVGSHSFTVSAVSTSEKVSTNLDTETVDGTLTVVSESDDEGAGADDTNDDFNDETPGFGIVVAALALLGGALFGRWRLTGRRDG